MCRQSVLEILHPGVELSDTEKLKLQNFNTLYDNWIDCGDNDASFIEMQNKLIVLFRYLLMELKQGQGIFQICKKEPMVKLRSIPYDLDENQRRILRPEDAETLDLGSMLIDCINNYSTVLSQEDFQSLGAPVEYIIENRTYLEKLQQEICEFQDVFHIYRDMEEEEDDTT